MGRIRVCPWVTLGSAVSGRIEGFCIRIYKGGRSARWILQEREERNQRNMGGRVIAAAVIAVVALAHQSTCYVKAPLVASDMGRMGLAGRRGATCIAGKGARQSRVLGLSMQVENFGDSPNDVLKWTQERQVRSHLSPLGSILVFGAPPWRDLHARTTFRSRAQSRRAVQVFSKGCHVCVCAAPPTMHCRPAPRS